MDAASTRRDVSVRGMTCAACEQRIERQVSAIEGVRSVRASLSLGRVRVECGSAVSDDAIAAAVRDAGYDVGAQDVPWLTRDRSVWWRLAPASVLASLLFILVRWVEARGTTVLSAGAFTLAASAAMGLVAGFSTCMAMLGGIVLGVSGRFAQRHPDARRWALFAPNLAFHGGRIVGFGLFGGILARIGATVLPGDRTMAVASIVVGVVTLLVGLRILGVSPRIARWTPTLPRVLQARGSTRVELGPFSAAVLAGGASFFLPCGFTLAVQLAATRSARFDVGALSMAAFAIGTTPGLLGLASLGALARGRAARLVFSTIGVAVVAFGFQGVQSNARVLAELAVRARAQPVASVGWVGRGPVHTIATVVTADGYRPMSASVAVGERVRWVITTPFAVHCANALRVPALALARQLRVGENVIEFTPLRSGRLEFRCAMAMAHGWIDIVGSAER